MKLKYLEYFVEIAEQKSIHKAADILYNSQPNLTRAVQSLEKELGQKLLIRSSQGVELTQVGESVYYYAKSIISQMNSLEQIKWHTEDVIRSELTVSVARLMLADELMLRFYEQVKSSHTTINLYETTIEDAIDNVSTLKSEIGIVVLNDAQLSSFRKVLEAKDVEMEEIARGDIYVHMSKDCPLNKKERIYVKDLLDYSYIHLPYDFFSNINYISQIDGIGLSQLKKTITMNNYHTIISMLNHTDAFIFGNVWQVQELARGNVSSRRVERISQKGNLIWMKRRKEILSSNAKKFLKLIKEYYQKNGGGGQKE